MERLMKADGKHGTHRRRAVPLGRSSILPLLQLSANHP